MPVKLFLAAASTTTKRSAAALSRSRRKACFCEYDSHVMADPRLRQLSIKTGVVKRLAKEKTVCEKEVLIERKRFDKFTNEGADAYVLKQQEEVIQECLMMLPDSIRRLQKELESLQKFLEDEKDLKESKEFVAATLVANEAIEVLSKST